MGRFEPVAGLDQIIATKFGRPAVSAALDALADAARSNAPPVRIWVTMRDEKVRPSHVEADGQAIPANLRFKLTAKDGTVELGRHPRDPALSAHNSINCRCDDPTTAGLLAESIHRTDVQQYGTRVVGEVYTEFPRAAESEFGTSEDSAAHFMTNALKEVALRMRSGRAR